MKDLGGVSGWRELRKSQKSRRELLSVGTLDYIFIDELRRRDELRFSNSCDFVWPEGWTSGGEIQGSVFWL